MFFASDNTSGIVPEVMAALARANEGCMPSYGSDPIMTRVRDRIRDLFEAPEAAVYLVATGTAANALALAIACPPWGAVFCHRAAHVTEDECGAPEFFTGGAKLVLVEGSHGRMTPETLSASLSRTGASGVHGVQRGCLTITNVTEAGTGRCCGPDGPGPCPGPALPYGWRALCQCAGGHRGHPGRDDVASGYRHPVLRRHQERADGGRGGGDL
jgi:hypothetical protein